MVPALGPKVPRPGELSGEHQQQAEAVIGQVLADQPFLAGQHDWTVDELWIHEGIDAGRDRLRGDGHPGRGAR